MPENLHGGRVGRGMPSDNVPADYERHRQLSADGQHVSVRGDQGQSLGTFDFSVLPAAEPLRRLLAAAFDLKAGATGTWKSSATCEAAYRYVKPFARWLATREPVPSAPSDLTPALWNEWVLQSTYTDRSHIRPLLLAATNLPEETRRRMERQVFRPPVGDTDKPMTDSEVRQVATAAKAIWRPARERILGNVELLAQWRADDLDSATDRWQMGRLLDIVSRGGCLPATKWTDLPADARRAYLRSIGRPDAPVNKTPTLRLLHERLYLNTQEVLASFFLMVIEGGYNRSVLETMETAAWRPDASAGGTPLSTVKISKPRRGADKAHSSETFADRGPGSVGHLYARICEVTQPARDTVAAVGHPTDRLFVFRPATGDMTRNCYGGLRVGLPQNQGVTLVYWSEEAGLVDGDGAALRVSPQRLRAGVVPRKGVPRQHSRRTHDDYALRDARGSGSHDEIIAAGIEDAIANARTHVGVTWLRFGDSRAPKVAELLGVPADVMEEILTGRRDTPAAACRDHTDSPFAPQGEPCPASFLSCFACGNAIATPAHLPRLVYLDEALAALRLTVDPAYWQGHYADPAVRLRRLLDENTTAAQRVDARKRLDPLHAEIIEGLLARKWDA